VLSNSPGPTEVMSLLGIQRYFSAVVAADSAARKPDRDAFQKGCGALGVAPEETAHVPRRGNFGSRRTIATKKPYFGAHKRACGGSSSASKTGTPRSGEPGLPRTRWLIAGAVPLAALTAGVTVALMAWSPWNGNDDKLASPSQSTQPTARSGLTRTEAEALALNKLRDPQDEAAQAWFEQGYSPFCEARERLQDRWLVVCGMEKPAHAEGLLGDLKVVPADRVEQIITFKVYDTGRIGSY
jgi:hypothetical protein